MLAQVQPSTDQEISSQLQKTHTGAQTPCALPPYNLLDPQRQIEL